MLSQRSALSLHRFSIERQWHIAAGLQVHHGVGLIGPGEDPYKIQRHESEAAIILCVRFTRTKKRRYMAKRWFADQPYGFSGGISKRPTWALIFSEICCCEKQSLPSSCPTTKVVPIISPGASPNRCETERCTKRMPEQAVYTPSAHNKP